jgi:TRAP-type C4-dicarboxylate transport system permease small subunit
LHLVARLYDGMLRGMAMLGGLLMVATMVSIMTDVVLRNLGTQSSAHLFTFTEYALLLIPLLGAPWLVREKGHIYVEVLINSLPRTSRQVLVRAILFACIAVCAVLAWYAGGITVQNYVLADKDVRSFDMPRWMLMAFMPLSFGMMALEFLRLAVRGENPFGRGLVAGRHEE